MRKQFAVVGNPIEQSRSPELHHAFAEKTGVDLVYRKRLAPLDGFEANIREFFAEGGVGMNVTVPFKEQAFALCDVLSERAKTAKAVNTLWMQDGQPLYMVELHLACWRTVLELCKVSPAYSHPLSAAQG